MPVQYYMFMYQVLHDGVLSLDLSECSLSAAELGLVWRLCPRLKKLDIGIRSGCRDTLHSSGEMCTCVGYDIESSSHLAATVSICLVWCCPPLSPSLLLSAALSQLLSHLPSLLSLSLQCCTLTDHTALLSLTSSSPLLTSLTLSGCHMVADRSVVAIAARLRYLQALSLARTKASVCVC